VQSKAFIVFLRSTAGIIVLNPNWDRIYVYSFSVFLCSRPDMFTTLSTKCLKNKVLKSGEMDGFRRQCPVVLWSKKEKCTNYEVFIMNFFLLLLGLWGYWHCGHSWPIVPASGDSEDDCGEADGM
jgi:hypothetical protein